MMLIIIPSDCMVKMVKKVEGETENRRVCCIEVQVRDILNKSWDIDIEQQCELTKCGGAGGNGCCFLISSKLAIPQSSLSFLHCPVYIYRSSNVLIINHECFFLSRLIRF